MSQITAVNSIDNTTATQSTNASGVKSTSAANSLGKQDFLNLLVKQLQNQDPLNPTDNTAFIAQLAQFSSLEQMTNLNTSMSQLMNSQLANEATGFIGKNVSIKDAQGNQITGTVSKVVIESGTPKIIVNNNEYTLDQVQQISN